MDHYQIIQRGEGLERSASCASFAPPNPPFVHCIVFGGLMPCGMSCGDHSSLTANFETPFIFTLILLTFITLFVRLHGRDIIENNF